MVGSSVFSNDSICIFYRWFSGSVGYISWVRQGAAAPIFPVLTRGFWAADHWAAAANQNVTVTIPRKKLAVLLPWFPHRLQHGNGAEGGLIPNKTPKIVIRPIHWLLITRDISCNPMRQMTFGWLLESDWNHHPFRQSTQCPIEVSVQACEERGVA